MIAVGKLVKNCLGTSAWLVPGDDATNVSGGADAVLNKSYLLTRFPEGSSGACFCGTAGGCWVSARGLGNPASPTGFS